MLDKLQEMLAQAVIDVYSEDVISAVNVAFRLIYASQ